MFQIKDICIMIKGIGRLDSKEIKAVEQKVDQIFRLFEANEKDKGLRLLSKTLTTQNYFVREIVGKKLAEFSDQAFMDQLVLVDLTYHKIYGVRAAALFFYWEKYKNVPNNLILFLDSFWDNTPWEVEAIIADMWRRFPHVTKEHMLRWLESPDLRQRALAFHGMEYIANEDPQYILECLNRTIDDPSVEVQKKITHVITQVARMKPAECYPFIREWLSQANDIRLKTIWVSMKKLVNIINQKNSRERNEEFILLTQQTIRDWKNDENEHVSSIGAKLCQLMESPNSQDYQ